MKISTAQQVRAKINTIAKYSSMFATQRKPRRSGASQIRLRNVARGATPDDDTSSD
jgi:hypothetical protein